MKKKLKWLEKCLVVLMTLALVFTSTPVYGEETNNSETLKKLNEQIQISLTKDGEIIPIYENGSNYSFDVPKGTKQVYAKTTSSMAIQDYDYNIIIGNNQQAIINIENGANRDWYLDANDEEFWDKVITIVEKEEANPDQEAADKVIQLIKAIPSLDEMVRQDNDKIKEARTAYKGLTDEQKKLVNNYETLTAAENKMKEIEKAAVIDDLNDMIKISLSAEDGETFPIYANGEHMWGGVNYCVDLPNGTQKVFISLKSGMSLINQSYNVIVADGKSNEISVEYGQENHITTFSSGNTGLLKITFIEKAKDDPNQKAADVVIDKINKLPNPAAITAQDEEKIKEARTAYDGLTKEQKELVTNYSSLIDIEKRLSEIGNEETQLELSRAIIWLSSSVIGSNYRYSDFYMIKDGENNNINYIKINTYVPAGKSTKISYAIEDSKIANIVDTGSNTIKLVAASEGETNLVIYCGGNTKKYPIHVYTKDKAVEAVKEAIKTLPDSSKDLNASNIEAIIKYFPLVGDDGLTYSEISKYLSGEDAKKLNTVIGSEYKKAAENFFKSQKSTMNYGSIYHFTSVKEAYAQMKSDSQYYSEANKIAFKEWETLYNEYVSLLNSSTDYTTLINKQYKLIDEEKTLVQKMMSTLPSKVDVTLEDENDVIAARNGYELLCEKAKEGLPQNSTEYKKLKDAESVIAELKARVYPTDLAVEANKATMKVTEEKEIKVSFIPENTTQKKLTYKSADENIAVVSKDGVITAKKEGNTTVTVTTEDGKVTKTIDVVVESGFVPVESITFTKTQLDLDYGQKTKLSVSIAPENATNKNLIWSSEDEKIVTVNKSGEIIGFGVGTTNIVVKDITEKIISKCKVTVTPRIQGNDTNVYFRHSNGLITELDDNIITLEQSDSGCFVMEGNEKTAYWKNERALTSTNKSAIDLFAMTGEVRINEVGETKAWVMDSDAYDEYGDDSHLYDFTIKTVPSSYVDIKAYIDNTEMDDDIFTLNGSESKSITVRGLKEGQKEYEEIPYYALGFTSDSEYLHFGTSAQNGTFNISKDEYAKIKVSLLNTEIKKEFNVKSKFVQVEKVIVNTPETFYITDWSFLNENYVGISPYVGSQTYSVKVLPENATNKQISWESNNTDIAYFTSAHLNGFQPLKAGVAKFKAICNSNPSLNQDVQIKFEYKYPLQTAAIDNFTCKLSDQGINLPINMTPANATEQRFNFSFSKEGIATITDSIVSENGNKVTKHIVSPLKEGTVTVTATPRDNTVIKTPITFSLTVEKGAEIKIDYDEMLKTGLNSAKNYLKNANQNSYGSEWNLFSLVRMGETISEENRLAYYKAISEKVKDDKFYNKLTDSERVLIGLEAIGYDALDVGGVNLYEKIYNYDDSLATMGSNDLSYALISLDLRNTYIPEDANWSRQRLIENILKYQKADGGFGLGLDGGSGVDMTCMCLQALVRYNNIQYPQVQTAVNNAFKFLKQNLDINGGYGNSNSDSQLITTLSMYGIDPALEETGWYKGVVSKNVLTSLDSYRVLDTGYKYLSSDKKVNGMATVQAAYALESYRRMKNNEPNIYDYSDIEKKEISAQSVISAINNLPEKEQLTFSNMSYVEGIRAMYNSLSEENKAKVTNISTLEAAEKYLADLEKQQQREGYYIGRGKGFNPQMDIVLLVQIKNGDILDIKEISQDETNERWENAKGLFKAIIDSNSTDVDAISGATYSSNGIKEAVNDALSKAPTSMTQEELDKFVNDNFKSYGSMIQPEYGKDINVLSMLYDKMEELGENRIQLSIGKVQNEKYLNKEGLITYFDGSANSSSFGTSMYQEFTFTSGDATTKSNIKLRIGWNQEKLASHIADEIEKYDIIKLIGDNDNENHIFTNLRANGFGVTNKGDSYTAIKWVSSNEEIISNTGKLTRPEVNTKVILTATFSQNPATICGDLQGQWDKKADDVTREYVLYVTGTKSEADEQVVTTVTKIFDTLVWQETNVELKTTEARKAYDALTDDQKALVGKDIYEILLESEKYVEDKKAAANIDKRIEAIGKIALESEALIASIKKDYEALTEDQKALVTKLDILHKAEVDLEVVKEDYKKAKVVIDLINSIGKVTLESEAKILKAIDAYGELTDAQSELVTNYDVVKKAYATLLQLKKDKLNTPTAVTGVSVIGKTYNSISIKWTKNSKATKYRIYRATSKHGTYSYIAYTSKSATTFTDKKVTTGKTYYYKVRAVNGSLSGALSKYTYAIATPYQTKSVYVHTYGSKAFKIGWSRQTGVTGYRVYKATSRNGKYVCVSTIKGYKNTSYIDKKVKHGKTYYYKVRAYKTVSKKMIFGSYSSIKYKKR